MVPFLFVMFQYRTGCHLFSATAIAALLLGRFFDVLVLTLLFLANAPHMFLLSRLVHVHLLHETLFRFIRTRIRQTESVGFTYTSLPPTFGSGSHTPVFPNPASFKG